MRPWLRLLLILWIGAIAQAAPAQSILQRLITPGPLSNAHTRFEANCEACHQSFSREAQNGKCLSCHRGIAADLRQGSGFHSKSNARGQPCKACHTEHKGKGAGLIRFNRAGFNHAQTDYPLAGAHARAPCAGCHATGNHYRGIGTTCISCHAKKDVHAGRFGRNCTDCHSIADWKKTTAFDHARTGYVLTGAHRSAACTGCHAGSRYKGTPSQCISCHAKKDVHNGARGTACANCHNTGSWKGASFDHDRDTSFALLGRHASLGCAACHGASNAIRKPPRGCVGCHASDDIHKGRNGTACASCHNNSDWKQNSFDHNRMTRFPLTGAHKPIECSACHKKPAHEVHLSVECIGCHVADDAHKGKFGRDCATCHNVVSWNGKVAFDHALTRFPLIGKHVPLACSACHADKKFSAKGITCESCHIDDHHAGTLGIKPACETCHNSNGWPTWRFDHDTQTRFPLTGKHKALICTACHSKAEDPAKAPVACVSCHRRDDIHKSEFGEDCGQCHITSSFSEIMMSRRR